jgi:hypothetical protein
MTTAAAEIGRSLEERQNDYGLGQSASRHKKVYSKFSYGDGININNSTKDSTKTVPADSCSKYLRVN